jgi:hypothetical protein
MLEYVWVPGYCHERVSGDKSHLGRYLPHSEREAWVTADMTLKPHNASADEVGVGVLKAEGQRMSVSPPY